MSNIVEQLNAKTETLNVIIRYIEELQKLQDPEVGLKDVKSYLETMRNSYKQAFDLLKRQQIN